MSAQPPGLEPSGRLADIPKDFHNQIAHHRTVNSSRNPDILFIVVDCARATDLVQGPVDAAQLPTWSRLARQARVYRNAVSPGSWTLPSHASMLTGLQPWEHGMLAGLTSKLQTGTATIAEILSRAGYSTGCFSANPLVSADTGLTAGFSTALWGRFLDCYIRPLSGKFTRPSMDSARSRGSIVRALELETGRVLRSAFKKAVLTFPAAFDAALRAGARAAGSTTGIVSDVSPWIDQAFADWLNAVPATKPTFAFVNLLDAHEPYLCLPEAVGSIADWFRLMRVRQDSLQLFFGERVPRTPDLLALHALYREALRVADRRVGQLLELFSEARDVDNSIVIVTSDHGQAFGERGQIYHGRGTTDEIVRVPLLIRYPPSWGISGVVDDWVSTTSIMPQFVLSHAGVASTGPPAHSIGEDGPRSASDAVLSFSEFRERSNGDTADPRSPIQSGCLAAYSGSLKVHLDLKDSRVRAFDEASVGAPEIPYDAGDSLARRLLNRLQVVAGAIGKTATPDSVDPVSRLSSWGY